MAEDKEKNRKPANGKTKLKLWVSAGGRCQYRGCNTYLFSDEISMKDMNRSNIAHIYGAGDDEDKTPRYHSIYSKELSSNFENLMLLCPSCHRRIDQEQLDEHSAELLIEMKQEHENRILSLTSIKEEVKTHVLFYSSRIGKLNPNIDFNSIRKVLAERSLFPTSSPIELGVKNNPVEDNEEFYWDTEMRYLEDNFNKKVIEHFTEKGINHFSLFAIAPQPLLIKLGTLIPELYSVDVYQKHRETDSWAWQTDPKDFDGFIIEEPQDKTGIPVLNISLSATIENDRITEVIEGNASIWKLTINKPNSVFVKHQSILIDFKAAVGSILNTIKSKHGHTSILKVFPAMPISTSIEFGRTWMPKADMSMEIYDERNGFKKALEIKRNK